MQFYLTAIFLQSNWISVVLNNNVLANMSLEKLTPPRIILLRNPQILMSGYRGRRH